MESNVPWKLRDECFVDFPQNHCATVCRLWHNFAVTLAGLAVTESLGTRGKLEQFESKMSEEYEKYGLNLLESLLNIGEDLTDEEVITLVEAANV